MGTPVYMIKVSARVEEDLPLLLVILGGGRALEWPDVNPLMQDARCKNDGNARGEER